MNIRYPLYEGVYRILTKQFIRKTQKIPLKENDMEDMKF